MNFFIECSFSGALHRIAIKPNALPGGHMDALAKAVAPGGEVVAVAHQAGAEAAGAQQEIAPYSQGRPPKALPRPCRLLMLRWKRLLAQCTCPTKSTLSVEGDPRQLDKRLRAA